MIATSPPAAPPVAPSIEPEPAPPPFRTPAAAAWSGPGPRPHHPRTPAAGVDRDRRAARRRLDRGHGVVGCPPSGHPRRRTHHRTAPRGDPEPLHLAGRRRCQRGQRLSQRGHRAGRRPPALRGRPQRGDRPAAGRAPGGGRGGRPAGRAAAQRPDPGVRRPGGDGPHQQPARVSGRRRLPAPGIGPHAQPDPPRQPTGSTSWRRTSSSSGTPRPGPPRTPPAWR